MAAAEDWLRARGIEKLQLMVRGDNAKVHAFYRSLGYTSRNAWCSPNGSTGASRRRNRKQWA